MPKLKKIEGVEVFAAGVWNGDEYSVKDLDEMVKCFEENSTQKPPLKIGHDDRQMLLQRDGMPAAGWVGNLYRKGEKLLADFVDIPSKVYDLLKLGAYKKVSAEIYWNAKIGEAMYRRVLGAVALLGADTPGVTNLKDIFDMYSLQGGELRVYDSEQKCFTIEIDKLDLETTGELTMNEKEQLMKVTADLEAEQKKNHTLQESVEKLSKLEGENAELKKFVSEAKAREEASAKAAEEAKLDATVTELASEHLITPAMKPYVRALIGEEKKEYSFVDKEEEKKFSKSGLLKEVLKLHKATLVNTEEGSEDGNRETDVATGQQQALHEEIQKYQTEHKCSYKAAYKAVVSQHEGDYVDEAGEEVGDEDDGA